MKRAFDISLSLFGIIIFFIPMLVIAMLIKKEDGGPVLYRGVRVGKNNKDFKMNKFRTMFVDADKIGPSSTGEDDPRITKIGSFIRRYKLDELPQLFNVLFGSMSFVGPRPQVRWAVEGYSDKEMRLLEVRPGITDFASIKFSNEGEILKGYDDPDKAYMELIHPEKTRLALKYIDNRSVLLDVKILWMTVLAVMGKKVTVD
ncbi:sugar transferase [Limisalsivibrio acetivorans]|uniref:sugar transferase n=1 Tax=Limisalsivibrio acetivorans TaxID=1304888 RepID=UPI00047D27C3|nr:sugar transferase [Limisalsivibrio acetivorans]